MRIHLASILVDDQAKALGFYTDVLGFLPKADVDMGGPRWLTVVSPDAPTQRWSDSSDLGASWTRTRSSRAAAHMGTFRPGRPGRAGRPG